MGWHWAGLGPGMGNLGQCLTAWQVPRQPPQRAALPFLVAPGPFSGLSRLNQPCHVPIADPDTGLQVVGLVWMGGSACGLLGPATGMPTRGHLYPGEQLGAVAQHFP